MKNKMADMVSKLLSEGEVASGIMSMGSVVDSGSTAPNTLDTAENNLADEEDIRLSGKSHKTLQLMHFAEQLVNEEVSEDEELSKYGLISEGKLTLKGKEWIKKYLPTIYAS